MDYEIIFINDGSSDDTLEILKKLAALDSQIKILDFSRNFGKESAILAGFRESKGDFVVLVDADLQDPIDLLPQMFQLIINNDIDMVCIQRKRRDGDGKIRAFLSNMFYWISKAFLNIQLQNGIRDFRLMKKDVVDAILQIGEYHRFSKGIFEWVGFKKVFLEYSYIDREKGQSGWGFRKLFRYALDGIFSFSAIPLRLSFILGFLSSFFALIYGIYIVIDTLIFGNAVKGYPSLVCIITFFGGIQLIVMGIIGEYIARIYEQVKNRPHYILKKGRKNDEK